MAQAGDIRWSLRGGDIALIEWDLQGEKVNKMSSPVMALFRSILEEIRTSPAKAVVIISRKKNIFIAGADIKEIENLKTPDEFERAVVGGQDILNMVEDLPQPVIAAVHGACLGGGCELILACDYRICSDDEATQIGLPEVKLGILPGFGGCVRLPRVVGLMSALDIILPGGSARPSKAKRIGLVDKVVPPGELESEAVKLAKKVIKKGEGKRPKVYQPRSLKDRLMNSSAMRSKVFSEAKKSVLKATGGHYPAPLKALEVVRKTYGMKDRTEALKIEREAFCEVAVTDVSKNLIGLFFQMEAMKSRTGVTDSSVKPKKVHQVGVLGAGTMGGGIAATVAEKGMFALMKDINQEALDLGYRAADSIWEKKVRRKRLNKLQLAERKSRRAGTLDYSEFGKLDVIIEAIVENMEIKKKVIAEAASHVREDAIMATNTSSLSVTEMSAAHPHPQNFLGMHFFNPVDKMPLVEVIRGEKSSDEAVATIFSLAKQMGKTPVVVKDSPGFLVNRLLIPYLIEAAHFLQEGMSVEVIDRAFQKSFGMPMGPCRLMDEVGLDVCVKVSKIFRESLGDRIEIPESMLKLESTDRLGKKNHKGFYLYDSKGKQGGVDPGIYKDLGLSEPTNPHSPEELLRRGMYNMVNEASMVLIEEKVVESAADLDLAMIMGTGFPPFRGGLLKWADREGLPQILSELEVFAAKYGKRFKPSAALISMAGAGEGFMSVKRPQPSPSATL